NGKYATVNWTPIWYYYRAMDFDDLIDLYMTSDIAMITPVRDGMNLVAKEFVATRVSGDGVLILSEMAGASKELFEAVLVNPFDRNAMADALKHAITMPLDEQKRRNVEMQKRLRRYSVEYWAKEFMQALQLHSEMKANVNTSKVDANNQQHIVDAFHNAQRKAIVLDYDGTLVSFHENPEAATPDQNLVELLQSLCLQPNTDIAIISGRDQAFIEKWFGDLPLRLVAEHGYYVRPRGKKWTASTRGDKQWMDDIKPIFESFMDRTPGTFIEEKHNSLVWHYRKTDPELAAGRVVELKTVLSSLISDQLSMMDMDKALEVIDRQIDKGTAVAEMIGQHPYDFILCIGDDVTDENMFGALPDDAFTIKVGKKPTIASYSIAGVAKVKELLGAIITPSP
ncbi:MAG: trehalose-phosphatase, partial [Bacteroidota bacterium]|nr:trehalose-phosphatase [Bacteroidota bacterium]